jgi:formamidopyrimidine-DNA glycosylase
VFFLSRGPRSCVPSRIMVCHLAMSGYWDVDDDPWTFDYVEGRRRAVEGDVRVCLTVRDPDRRIRILRFHDSRLFGRLTHREFTDGSLPKVGPELLGTRFQLDPQGVKSGAELRERLARRPDWPIKRALMEQTLVAGLGNIYASEALYESGIHPLTPVRDVVGWDTLFVMCQDAMISAINRNLDYSPLSVYRRKTCKRHRTPIESVEVAGRTSYFCSTCQPPPR